MRKVLLGTIYGKGGVETMHCFVSKTLQEGGFEVDIAYHAPYKIFPHLSVPFWKIGQRKPSVFRQKNTREWLVGSWFPELESKQTSSSKIWSDLIHKFDNHIVVSGSALAAYPFVQAKVKPLCWFATSYLDEKITHLKKFNFFRRTISFAERSFCEKQEKEVLGSCPVMALSNYAAHKLQSIMPQRKFSILHMPVEIPAILEEEPRRFKKEYTIGFFGRINDSRKNIALLLHSTAILKRKIPDLKLLLVGGKLSGSLFNLAKSLKIINNLEVVNFVDRKDLPKFYRQLDVFVIPSFQEGLCIAGLEAVASGIPVVSTKCGGPADFIINGENGFFVDFSPDEMADSILSVVGNPQLWKKMSKSGVDLIRKEFSLEKCREVFWKNFQKANELRKAA